MSHTLHFTAPAIALAGLFIWASLVAPTTVFAQSVSSERALLNTHAELRGMAILRGEDQRLQIDPAGSQAVTADQALWADRRQWFGRRSSRRTLPSHRSRNGARLIARGRCSAGAQPLRRRGVRSSGRSETSPSVCEPPGGSKGRGARHDFSHKTPRN